MLEFKLIVDEGCQLPAEYLKRHPEIAVLPRGAELQEAMKGTPGTRFLYLISADNRSPDMSEYISMSVENIPRECMAVRTHCLFGGLGLLVKRLVERNEPLGDSAAFVRAEREKIVHLMMFEDYAELKVRSLMRTEEAERAENYGKAGAYLRYDYVFDQAEVDLRKQAWKAPEESTAAAIPRVKQIIYNGTLNLKDRAHAQIVSEVRSRIASLEQFSGDKTCRRVVINSTESSRFVRGLYGNIMKNLSPGSKVELNMISPKEFGPKLGIYFTAREPSTAKSPTWARIASKGN